MVRLGDVATYINGYAFKPSDWSDTGLPIIRIQNIVKKSVLDFYGVLKKTLDGSGYDVEFWLSQNEKRICPLCPSLR